MSLSYLSPVIKLSPVKPWTVMPMRDDQIPLMSQWIARLDSSRELDRELNLITAQIRGELQLADRTGYPDYYTGALADRPVFFMNGYATKGKSYHLGTKTIRKDYRLNLLIDPALHNKPGACLRAWQEALVFLFDNEVGRVLVELDTLSAVETAVLNRLGFKMISLSRGSIGRESYLACRRLDFTAAASRRR